MISIALTQSDRDRAGRIAADRMKGKHGGKEYGTMSRWERGMVGVLGEIVVEKVYGVKMDEGIYVGGDSGKDFTFGNVSVAVRTTEAQNGRLMLNNLMTTDVGILVTIRENRSVGEITGWAYREIFNVYAQEMVMHGKKCYALARHFLKEGNELLHLKRTWDTDHVTEMLSKELEKI